MAGSTQMQDFTLTLSGSAQPLSDAFQNKLAGGPDDSPLQWLSVQPDAANSGIIYFGASLAVSSSLYGFRMEVPVSSIPSAPFLWEPAQSRIRASDIFLKGTANDKLHILMVAY